MIVVRNFLIFTVILATFALAETPMQEAARKAKKAQEDRAEAIKQCTFKGEVSQKCVDLEQTYKERRRDYKETDYNTTDFPSYVGDLRSCFANANMGEKFRGNTSDATGLLQRGLPENMLLTECFRVTDKVFGTKWRAEAELPLKRAAFVRNVAEKVEANFRKKCGMGGRVEEGGRVRLIVDKVSKRKNSFYTGKDPEGNTITVHCSGQVSTKYAHGGSSLAEPRTEAGAANDAAESACMIECARTNIHCPSHNFTEAACNAACKPKCAK